MINVFTKEDFILEDSNLLKKYSEIELIKLVGEKLFQKIDFKRSNAFLVGNGNNGSDALALALEAYKRNIGVTIYILDSSKRSESNEYFLTLINKLSIPLVTLTKDTIFNEEGKIWVENHLELFPTLIDAKKWINLRIDGTNKRIPKIIGEWK